MKNVSNSAARSDLRHGLRGHVGDAPRFSRANEGILVWLGIGSVLALIVFGAISLAISAIENQRVPWGVA